MGWTTEVTDPLYEVLWGAYRSSDGSVFAEPVAAPLDYGTEFPGWSGPSGAGQL